MNEVSKKNLKNEVASLKKIDHPNLVKLIEVIETKQYISIV